jgi:hypothetical protein
MVFVIYPATNGRPAHGDGRLGVRMAQSRFPIGSDAPGAGVFRRHRPAEIKIVEGYPAVNVERVRCRALLQPELNFGHSHKSQASFVVFTSGVDALNRSDNL